MHFCLRSSTSDFFSDLVSHLQVGESHREQARVVLILCVLNLALCLPRIHSQNKFKTPKPYPLSTSSLFTVTEVRKGSFFSFFFISIHQYSVPFWRQYDKTCFKKTTKTFLICSFLCCEWVNKRMEKFDTSQKSCPLDCTCF